MPTYTAGKRVSQEQYGSGTVLESNEHHTVIDFDEHGVRRFVTSMVVLKTSTVPAPTKPPLTNGGRRKLRDSLPLFLKRLYSPTSFDLLLLT